eukprot:4986427-Pyramimonas_sp.AAC.1
MLMHDDLKIDTPEWITGQGLSMVGGHAHALFFIARKASRVFRSQRHMQRSFQLSGARRWVSYLQRGSPSCSAN